MAARKGKPMLMACQPPSGRITQSQAAANRAMSVVAPSEPLPANTELKLTARGQTKRGAVDENASANSAISAPRPKRCTVLKYVTKLCHVNPSKSCASPTKLQLRPALKVGQSPSKNEQCAKKVPKPLVAAGGTFVNDSKRANKTQKADLLSQKKNPNIELNRDTACHEAIIVARHARHQSKSTNSKAGDSAGSDIVGIDKDNGNPQMCVSFVAEIYTNLMASEISDEFKLVPDTLYLTVILIDQYLSQKSIHRKKLQLLGVTSMFIASKYEEICAPSVEQFCNMTDNAYRKAEVLEMECQVLNVLGFHLSTPTPKKFVRRFLRAAQATSNVSAFNGVSIRGPFLQDGRLTSVHGTQLLSTTPLTKAPIFGYACALYGSFNITLYESVAYLKSPQPPESLFN